MFEFTCLFQDAVNLLLPVRFERIRKCSSGSGFGVLVNICCVEGMSVLEGVIHNSYERAICF